MRVPHEGLLCRSVFFSAVPEEVLGELNSAFLEAGERRWMKGVEMVTGAEQFSGVYLYAGHLKWRQSAQSTNGTSTETPSEEHLVSLFPDGRFSIFRHDFRRVSAEGPPATLWGMFDEETGRVEFVWSGCAATSPMNLHALEPLEEEMEGEEGEGDKNGEEGGSEEGDEAEEDFTSFLEKSTRQQRESRHTKKHSSRLSRAKEGHYMTAWHYRRKVARLRHHQGRLGRTGQKRKERAARRKKAQTKKEKEGERLAGQKESVGVHSAVSALHRLTTRRSFAWRQKKRAEVRRLYRRYSTVTAAGCICTDVRSLQEAAIALDGAAAVASTSPSDNATPAGEEAAPTTATAPPSRTCPEFGEVGVGRDADGFPSGKVEPASPIGETAELAGLQMTMTFVLSSPFGLLERGLSQVSGLFVPVTRDLYIAEGGHPGEQYAYPLAAAVVRMSSELMEGVKAIWNLSMEASNSSSTNTTDEVDSFGPDDSVTDESIAPPPAVVESVADQGMEEGESGEASQAEPVATTEASVQCLFTVDNKVESVTYGREDLTSSVEGELSNWKSLKTVSFVPQEGAALVIRGHNFEANSCATGALVFRCTDSAGRRSAWNLETGRGASDGVFLRSVGAESLGGLPPVGADSDEDFPQSLVAPCVATAGISEVVPGNQHKRWASSGEAYAAFRIKPTYVPLSLQEPVGELVSGQFKSEEEPVTLSLNTPFSDPIVIPSLLSTNGGHPAVISAVLSEGETDGGHGWTVTAFVVEPSCFDGRHTRESADFLVMEKGKFLSRDGKAVEVGSVEIPQGETSVVIQFETSFGATPALLSAVQRTSDSNSIFVKTRLRSVSATSAEILIESDTVTEVVGPLRIGYMALDEGAATLPSLRLSAFIKTESMTSSKSDVALPSTASSSETPAVFGTLASTLDDRTASLRSKGGDAETAELFLDADGCDGLGRSHNTAETVNLLAVGKRSFANTITGESMKCLFTVDNQVLSVTYGEEDLTSRVDGMLSDWPSLKSVRFEPREGAALVVRAHNWEGNSCATGAFVFKCTDAASSRSAWNLQTGFGTGNGVLRAVGASSEGSLPPVGAESDGDFPDTLAPPCVSTSGIHEVVEGVQQKRWAKDGQAFAAFRVKPDYVASPFPSPDLEMELRTSTFTHQEAQLSFSSEFAHPVVFPSLLTANGGDAAVVKARVVNQEVQEKGSGNAVSGWAVRFHVQEPDCYS
uniref:Uncharacterized protein n=1 Tax=Chromera velia CCMP2878 TaxID=1169474 RepID=A0A0G4GQX5_9ALVE|eukprot:Cvel_22977.t1-p1 / transcript=Cvel_22977.t1 / gene=Cvel_22977 / organism=Chromera_velia_CCMP2878 / gene_product=hypothetical protein / transcript_product=hypothetical protein / location=Cvel_scaffold2316:12424-19411(-) / protein_length=1213 / sequence_SO=supercontig / SO=protein_coding / is_pseudo=false